MAAWASGPSCPYTQPRMAVWQIRRRLRVPFRIDNRSDGGRSFSRVQEVAGAGSESPLLRMNPPPPPRAPPLGSKTRPPPPPPGPPRWTLTPSRRFLPPFASARARKLASNVASQLACSGPTRRGDQSRKGR
eukprot:6177752-Pyramimonas_sp.AAC.1